MNYLSIAIALLCFFETPAWANEPVVEEKVAALLFTAPDGWLTTDSKTLPGRVKAMVVCPDNRNYPPSINLAVEQYNGSLKDYLKIVKAINESQNAEWKNLGTIHTEAGKGNLSQVEVSSNFGPVRLMHVIMVKEGYAYIMTAAALRDEFPRYYANFFKSMQSLRFDQISSHELTDIQYEAATQVVSQK